MDAYYIIERVCLALQLQQSELTGKTKKREYCDGRHIATFIMRSKGKGKKDKVKYTAIAFIFKGDRKKHATAIASFKVCKTLLKVDKAFKEKYTKVLEAL